MQEPRDRVPGEGAFGLLMLALSLGLAWQAHAISGFSSLSSPGAFPMAAAGAMVLGSLAVVLRNRRRRAAPAPLAERARAFSTQITPAAVVVFAGFVLGYAALLDTLGFLPASFLFLVAAIGFLHRGGLGFTLGVALLSLALTYAVFRLVFTVVLPEGIVPEREILAWVSRLMAGTGGAE